MIKAIVMGLLLTSCVSIPKHVVRYDCSEADFKALKDNDERCLLSTKNITSCRENAYEIFCTRKSYFKRWQFPWGETVEIPCAEASSPAEHYICQ